MIDKIDILKISTGEYGFYGFTLLGIERYDRVSFNLFEIGLLSKGFGSYMFCLDILFFIVV